MNEQAKPVPNESQRWDAQWLDKMEGNIPNKNKPSLDGNQTEYIDPTVKR